MLDWHWGVACVWRSLIYQDAFGLQHAMCERSAQVQVAQQSNGSKCPGREGWLVLTLAVVLRLAVHVQVYDVLNADVIVMEKSALQTINSTYGAAAESSA